MTRRLAAALALGLAIAGAWPAPVGAQRIPPPELTITPQRIDFGSLLWGVSFGDANHGYAVGSYHTAFRTTDGGQTWARQPTPLPTTEPSAGDAEDLRRQAFTAVSFVDADHGFAVSATGAVIATSDGGATWEPRPTPAPASVDAAWPGDVRPSSWSFNAVSFVDPDHGVVVGHDGVILATADGGRSWIYQGKPQYGILRDTEFVDEFHGQVVGTGSGRADGIRYTSLGTNDAGETWLANLADSIDTPPADMSGVAVTVPMHAIVVGTGGRIFVTFDEGKSWRLRRHGTNETLHDVAFLDRRRGVAVGGVNFQGESRAVVLATNDGGERWTAFAEPAFAWFQSVTAASPSTAYAVGCTNAVVDGKGTCAAAVVKIDFPELDSSINAPMPSGGSSLPLVLLGAAALIAGAGLVIARRR